MKRLFCLLSALALLLQPVHAAQPPQQYLALTFDDGPSGALTERLLEKARYHFDAALCTSLDEAIGLARANSRRGLLICGSEAIALEAEQKLEAR